MRKTLQNLLKQYLWTNLMQKKQQYRLTQEQIGDLLQMSKRTFAGIVTRRYSLGALSLLLYLFFLADDPHKELDRLRELIFSKLDENDPILTLLQKRKQKLEEKKAAGTPTTPESEELLRR